jgi:hypothetical protein
MAIYPIQHVKTGEKKEIEMSVHDIEQWYKDNPEWKRDWAGGCASPGEVGEWRDKLSNKHPSWNTILKRAAK